MKILAVDDDPIILELLSEFFNALGSHDLTTALSGREALQLIDQNAAAPFDCFLLDIQMPQMDGLQLARHVRHTATYATAPILILTAMSEKRDIDGAFAAGATDYITKPFDLTELQMRVKLVELLVQSRKSKTVHDFASSTLLAGTNSPDYADLNEPFDLQDAKNVIAYNSMTNYVAQLSRSSLFGSTVFAFTLRKAEMHCENLSGVEFKSLIEDVAKAVSNSLLDNQFLMTYAGGGTYLCITGRGWRPDMTHLMDQINLRLSHTRAIANSGEELHPRVSAGVAIRLVWKAGGQILNSLSMAQSSAKNAAEEFERLKTDFFQMGKRA